MATQHGELFELGSDGPRVIVVGVDGSTTSLRAGAYAAGLARRQRSRLVIVYVASTSAISALVPTAAAALRQASEQLAEELRVQVCEAAVLRGVPCSFIATRGDPYKEIVRIAAEVRADAIVVGASASAGHRITGSLAVRLVRAGRWPVTVVP